MLIDLVLACLHHVGVFAIVAVIAAEIVLLRPALDASAVARLARLDLAYGIAAGLVVVAGFLRVFFGAKGSAFYLQNPVFWTKVGVFLVIGLVSIAPTLQFLAWRRALRADPAKAPSDAQVRRARRIVHAEAALLVCLPLLAAAMARGYGLD